MEVRMTDTEVRMTDKVGGARDAAEGAIEVLEEVVEEIVEEIIDLEEYAKTGRTPPRARHYRIRIDREFYTVSVPAMTGREILEVARKVPPKDYILRQIFAGGLTEKVDLDQVVHFTTLGIEKFKTMPKNAKDGRLP
jgi:hypothetical protein